MDRNGIMDADADAGFLHPLGHFVAVLHENGENMVDVAAI